VAVDGSGNIFVSDTANSRIVELDHNGNQGGAFGAGSGVVTLVAVSPATQASPYGIAIDNNGNIAAAASDNNIHLYLFSGAVITTIPGNVNNAFNNPRGVAFDSGNNLFVADSGYRQVEEFANWGLNQSPIAIFNGSGSLPNPTGVAVDGNGNIYVTDATNNDVVKFLP
jgi:sugar lactone lactonase YvrE